MAKDHPELLKVAMVSAASAAGSLPPPVADARRSVLYFDTGSAALKGEQAMGLAQLVATMAGTPALSATISGYHSAAGTLAQNQELAKQRAFAVRDAMRAAGIAEGRVILAKPQQTEANVAGEDPTARRVEVTLR
jgi:outer membrane protein OmpA-like peptidoglycan-associated protein